MVQNRPKISKSDYVLLLFKGSIKTSQVQSCTQKREKCLHAAFLAPVLVLPFHVDVNDILTTYFLR